MDNNEFLERLGRITKGLGKLSDELYNAAEPGVSNTARAEVISRARTRLKEYDDLLPILSEKRRETATTRCGSDIDDIRDRLKTLEKMK